MTGMTETARLPDPRPADRWSLFGIALALRAAGSVAAFLTGTPQPDVGAAAGLAVLFNPGDPASALAADGLHPVNLGKLVLNEDAPLPCTPNGCLHLLRRFGVELNGAKTVVIGRGVTVGRPIGLMLTRRSENSTVTLCHTGTKDLAAETREADIVIAAAGQPHMLTADMIKEGAALLDVGVSRVDGKLTGDIHPDCWDKAGYVSPNPGGVGPLTRAFLVRNIVERAEKLA